MLFISSDFMYPYEQNEKRKQYLLGYLNIKNICDTIYIYNYFLVTHVYLFVHVSLKDLWKGL